MFGGESVGRVQLYDRNFKLKEQISESEEAPIKQGAQPHLVDHKNFLEVMKVSKIKLFCVN